MVADACGRGPTVVFLGIALSVIALVANAATSTTLISGISVSGHIANTSTFVPDNVSSLTCLEYNPCLSNMVCCDVPQWYKDYINARIIELMVITNNSDAIAHGGHNLTAPNETISWLGTPPANESVYCCFSSEVCGESAFCEPEIPPSDIGGGTMLVAVVVICGLMLTGFVVVGCYLMPTETHVEIIAQKRRHQSEVLSQFDPRTASEAREVGWLDLH